MKAAIVVLTVTAILACTAASAASLFSDPVLVAPYRSHSAARADFDLDGHADLAVAGFSSDYLSVFFGNGEGSFVESRLDVALTDAVAVGDFNEDGLPDIAATSGPNEALVVLVWLGGGARTFLDPVSYVPVPPCEPVGQCGPVPCPYCYLPTIDVGDVDEDGHQDLVIGDSKWTFQDFNPLIVIRGGHSILLGDGNGTFGEVVDLRGGSGMLAGLGDFDGDRHLDFVVESERCIEGSLCDEQAPLDLYMGNGDGTFVSAGEVPGIAGVCDLAVLDRDGDGLDDLAVTSGDDLVLVPASGGGAFSAPAHFPAGPSPCRIETGDFDVDGVRDFVVGNAGMRRGSLLLGNPDGTLDPPVSVPTIHRIELPVAGDYDEDDVLDLAIVSREEGTLAFLGGRGDGSFRPVGRRDFPVGGSASGLLVFDLDLDGNLDLAAAHAPDGLSVLLGDGAGHLAASLENTVGASPRAVAAGRVNAVDQVPDLVVLNSSDASVLPGLGAGNFAPEIRVTLDPGPTSIVLADFNGDGLADLATSHGSPASAVVVRLGRGDGTFSAGRSHPVGADPRHLAAAHLDADGYLDLVTANRSSGDLSILRGGVGGSFLAETRVPLGGTPWFVAIGDVDRDARLDLVVATGQIAVLRGNGDGTFGPPSWLDPGDEYRNARPIADLDGDGLLDLGALGWRSNTAAVLLVRGASALEALGSFGTPGTPATFTAGDLDEDGRNDLVVGTAESVVSVLINRGPTTLGFTPDKLTLGWPYDDDAVSYEIYRGDLADLFDGDGDGLPDSGYGECQAENEPDRNEWIDSGSPAPGTGRFYLVGTVDQQGLADLGTTSAGLQRVPASVCP